MRVYKVKKEDVKHVTDVCCDKCGRSCIGHCGNFCGIHFTVSGGYDSPRFPDDETAREYDVCEVCAHEWLKTWPKDYLTITANVGGEC